MRKPKTWKWWFLRFSKGQIRPLAKAENDDFGGPETGQGQSGEGRKRPELIFLAASKVRFWEKVENGVFRPKRRFLIFWDFMNSSWQWAEADKRSKSLKRKLKIWAGPCLTKMTKTRKTTKKPKKVILVGRCPLKSFLLVLGPKMMVLGVRRPVRASPETGQGQSGEGRRRPRATAGGPKNRKTMFLGVPKPAWGWSKTAQHGSEQARSAKAQAWK